MSVVEQAVTQFNALPRDIRARGQEQWQQFTEAASQLDSFLAQAKDEVEQRREEAHERAIRACRSQLKTIEELDETIVRTEHRQREANDALSAARNALYAAKSTPLPRYALKEETDAHANAVSEAEKAADKAMEKTSHIEGVMATLSARRNDLVRQLSLLEGEEFDLRPAAEKKKAEADPKSNPFGLAGFAPPSMNYQ